MLPGVPHRRVALVAWPSSLGATSSREPVSLPERSRSAKAELASGGTRPARLGLGRSQFELDPGRIHLTSFLLATHPRLVRDAIASHRQRLDANPVDTCTAPGARLSAAAREAAGRFLGAPASEVALTDSTTMGLGLLYTRLALGPDDEVLTTEHDFYATHESLRLSGVRVRRIGSTATRAEHRRTRS